jgi:DNA-binding response OmpR family regulator
MMPDMDGWAVCKEIRRFNDLPILILSALNDPIQIASILDAGADDYLTKPVASSVLLAHIKRLVRRSTGKLLFDGISPLRFSEEGGPRTS